MPMQTQIEDQSSSIEEAKHNIPHPTESMVITIDESGNIINVESRLKNLALKDNIDSN